MFLCQNWLMMQYLIPKLNSTEVVHPCSPWMPWHEEFRPLQKNVDTDDTDKNKFFWHYICFEETRMFCQILSQASYSYFRGTIFPCWTMYHSFDPRTKLWKESENKPALDESLLTLTENTVPPKPLRCIIPIFPEAITKGGPFPTSGPTQYVTPMCRAF